MSGSKGKVGKLAVLAHALSISGHRSDKSVSMILNEVSLEDIPNHRDANEAAAAAGADFS